MISYGKKFLMLVMIITCSCSSNGENRNSTERIPISNDTISCSVLGQRLNDVFIIKNDINLKNKKCFLPPNVSLQFKGGIVRNGTLIGRMTKLFGKGIYFDKVRIEGSWDVPVIKSSFFKDLNYNNSIKDVIALSHPNINNKIIIGKSVFQVTANKYADVCVPICSNTELILNGIIKMSPNKYGKYFIIQAEGDNIIIRGKGQIVGDRNAHTGNDGEWGMGINLKGAHHVKIIGLTIKDCWGDCIYIGGKSADVNIEKCNLDNGRRQGISITSADGVSIRKCTITNVGGTSPEYAIDVEPNKEDVVNNILIEKVKVKDCKGGFLAYGKAQNARIGNIAISNCVTYSLKNYGVSIMKCDSVIVTDCILLDCPIGKTIYCDNVNYVSLCGNNYSVKQNSVDKLKTLVNKNVGLGNPDSFIIRNCKITDIKNNKVISK